MEDKKRIKVLFISPYPTEGPSNRYRIEQYLPYLKKAGIDCTIQPFMNSDCYKIFYLPKKRLKKLIYFLYNVAQRFLAIYKAKDYDVVFIHLEAFPIGPPFLEWILAKVMRKPIIFDFEDAIYLKRKGTRSWLVNLIKRPWKFYDILRLSAHIMVCNQYMKELVGRYNSNVTVIPTAIDTDKFIVKDLSLHNNKLILGWIGSPSTLPYLLHIKRPLQKISEKYNVALKIVGGGRDVKMPGVEVINEKWTLKNDIQSFQSLDIGLYPLPQDERAMAKTPFKTIQYMSVGMPVVASQAGAIGNIIKDGINGFLALTEEDWLKKLSILIENAQLRRDLGVEGRRTVEERYSVKGNAPKFLEILQNVYDKRYLKTGKN
ncbi:MAG: glycosyltransferase family 4 protein [Candidatus Omnitrophota bacterium]|nr:MAG: glycosyltransferase family 4 protein [Candidatus Omnitrophota bacterium]